MGARDHADRSAAMVAAARDRHEATRRRAAEALRRLDAVGDDVSFAAVARAAGVSRAWLYRDRVLRAEIDRLRAKQPSRRPPVVRPLAEQASQDSLRELRASLQAEVNALREENRRLKDALALKLGERRGTETVGRA